MAKEQAEDPKVQKKIDAALKSERSRVKKAIANVEWPEGTAVRAQYDIKRALNAALAA